MGRFSEKHEESYSCNLCGECFGTNSCLKSHNKYFHNIKSYSSESEGEIAEKDNENIKQHKLENNINNNKKEFKEIKICNSRRSAWTVSHPWIAVECSFEQRMGAVSNAL